MQQTRTKEEKQELIQLYKQSGMSVRAFAEAFNLNLATFRNWLYKKQPETKPADDNLNFVEVSPPILFIKIAGEICLFRSSNGFAVKLFFERKHLLQRKRATVSNHLR